MKLFVLFATLWGILDIGVCVSSKMDFEEDAHTETTSEGENGDLEVKHIITVSTSLKNNRRGLHSSSSVSDYNNPPHKKERMKEDSGEVPVMMGWKAVETTAIRTPDTRGKTLHRPESVYINRNIRDDYDVYPHVGISNPMQWKPSVHFNNINWWNQEGKDANFVRTIDRSDHHDVVKLHRKITNDGMKEFYCKKCAELNGVVKSCGVQARIATTTPKMKIDGKLAKLN